MNQTKTCTRCETEKPATTEFFAERKDKYSRSGLTSWCRDCLRERARLKQAERRSDPIERQKLLEEKRRYARSEKGREWKRRTSETDNHQRRQRLLSAKWDWTTEDWAATKQAWEHKCAYCGTITKGLHQDHFIPLAHPECTGPHPGNIIPACRICNLKKGHLHPKDYLKPDDYARIAEWLSRQDRR